MKERPILFSAPMVRALLDGSKTQTRRVVKKLNPEMYFPADMQGQMAMHCPYGQRFDQLWVREAWHNNSGTYEEGKSQPVYYRADYAQSAYDTVLRWKPSIHMPRWASRTTLEITGVRVERLQDISEKDCWAEGIEQVMHDFSDEELCVMAKRIGCSIEDAKPIYALLWESINGPCSWAANPWVWVVEFNVKGAK